MAGRSRQQPAREVAAGLQVVKAVDLPRPREFASQTSEGWQASALACRMLMLVSGMVRRRARERSIIARRLAAKVVELLAFPVPSPAGSRTHYARPMGASSEQTEEEEPA